MNPIGTSQGDSPSGSMIRPYRRIENLVTGLILIGVGLVLLAGNFGIHLPFIALDNWWALFILIGAVAPATRAVVRFRSVGGIDAGVAHWMLSALVTTTVALMFLLDVSFEVWWPVFVVIGGLYMLFPGRKGRERRRNEW